MNRIGRALLVAALVCLAPAAASAEIEENYRFDSLAGLVAGADVVFLGSVSDVSSRAPLTDADSCEYVDVQVAVDAVLSHERGPLPGQNALFTDFECGTGVAQLMAEYAGQRAVFFGHASSGRIPGGPARHWIPVIEAGHVHDQGGRVHVPQTLNAPFLARREGSSFAGFVSDVRSIAEGLPGTDSVVAATDGGVDAGSFLVAAASGLLLGAGLVRRRTRYAAR